MRKGINFDELFLLSLRSSKLLQWQIVNNIDLLEFADKKTLLAAEVILALIPKYKRKEMLGDIDANKILVLLKKERSDLYLIIIQHPNGRKWIGEQVENFRERFL